MDKLTEYVSPTQLQSIALALAAWAWFFLLAPSRSFKVGVDIQDMPVWFKLGGFKLLSIAALAGLAALAYFEPIQPDVVSGINRAFIDGDDVAAAPLAIALTAVLLLAFPGLVAAARAKRNLPTGGWRTPALSYFGWIWLGVVALIAIGAPQYYFPGLKSVLGTDVIATSPLNSGSAVGLAVAGSLFYLLWWGLPARDSLSHAVRGNTHAMASLSNVRWYGVPAWIMFRSTGPKRGSKIDLTGGERKFCPSCMRPIDNMEDYITLDFDHCPHCKELIPSPYSVRDFVLYCAERTMHARTSGATKGRGSKRASKMEEDYVQHLLRGLLSFGVRARATDIHLGPDANQLAVRYRIDGVLQSLFSFSMELCRPIISVIKVQAKLDISEQRKPQDGSFKTTLDELKLDVRVNTSPVNEGEAASLRLIYRSRCFGSIDHLGMSKRARELLEATIVQPHGLFLVTGPTGSGKSTTLYNSLSSITDGKRNIITLEDPIEFKIDGLTQMQIDPKKNFSFASGLRTILRQDPDVIMVGEVRDAETAKMAVDASMTGHLVFTTLHTIDTTTAIGRLFDLGVDPHQYAEALRLIVAQRLVRLNCPHCSEEITLTREDLAEKGMPGGPAKIPIRRGVGCDRCFKTGYFDREGIYETLQATQQIKALIVDRAAPYEIRDNARRAGMRTLLEDGMVKVLLGRTTIEELQRVTS